MLLRVKMEDPNDVLMAEEAVTAAHAFFIKLQTYAANQGKSEFDVLEELRAV